MPDTSISDAARAMGRIRTEKKAAASRRNGLLGGRPKTKANPAPQTTQPICTRNHAVLIAQKPETEK